MVLYINLSTQFTIKLHASSVRENKPSNCSVFTYHRSLNNQKKMVLLVSTLRSEINSVISIRCWSLASYLFPLFSLSVKPSCVFFKSYLGFFLLWYSGFFSFPVLTFKSKADGVVLNAEIPEENPSVLKKTFKTNFKDTVEGTKLEVRCDHQYLSLWSAATDGSLGLRI